MLRLRFTEQGLSVDSGSWRHIVWSYMLRTWNFPAWSRFLGVCGLAALVHSGMYAAETARPLWSLQPVVRPSVPAGVTASQNPIDAFIAEKYKQTGLVPTGPADKLTLL